MQYCESFCCVSGGRWILGSTWGKLMEAEEVKNIRKPQETSDASESHQVEQLLEKETPQPGWAAGNLTWRSKDGASVNHHPQRMRQPVGSGCTLLQEGSGQPLLRVDRGYFIVNLVLTTLNGWNYCGQTAMWSIDNLNTTGLDFNNNRVLARHPNKSER